MKLAALLCAGALSAQAFPEAPPPARPNVVLLMADDLGYGDLGCYGNERIHTPHLDAMAADGARFTRFHAAAPVCSPTRGSCLTGRHPYRYGIRAANDGHLPQSEITLQSLLRGAGYRTGHFGKWHLGTLTTEVVESNRGGPRGRADFAPPWERGFDVCFSTEAKVPTFDPMRHPETGEHYGTHYWNEHGEIVRENLDGDDSRVIMDRVVPFVRRSVADGVPFFAVVWFHAPHLPVAAGADDRARYAALDDETQRYFGCITAMDREVGRLRAELEELGVADDTILWFCSDNGPEGRAGRAPGSTGGLRGRKRSLYEGGTRVPSLLVWPRRVPAGRVVEIPGVTSDFLPTLAAWTGARVPEGVVLDGVDLDAVVRRERAERGQPIGFETGRQAAWNEGRYKLVAALGQRARGELYDLEADPGERTDLASVQPERYARMREALNAWRRSLRAARPHVMTLGPGWAATKVNTSIFRHHAIVTHGATQIAAWYSPEGTVVFARRDLASAEWTTHDTGWKGNVRDAHNGISLGVSRDGILHVSYDHHGNPLKYRRSAEPLDPTTFGPLIPMTGSKEQRVTYPQFVHLDDGTLLFFYRDGSSGRGDLCVNRYAPEAAEWTALHHPLISGAGTHNPYWMRPAVGRDGDLQLGWCWRRTGAAETNSRVCYARSRDGGVTWESSGGAGYELPITPATGEVVLPVAEGQNLSNQDSSDVDSQGRFHAVFRKNDADGVTQYHHLWRDGDAWRCGVVSDFDEPYDIRGGGSLRTPLSRPNLCIDGDDTVYVLYRDNRRGSRPMVIPLRPPGYAPGAEFALSEENLLQWEPLFDVVRWRRDRVLDLFVQATDQGDHETTTDRGAELVKVVEWRP